MCSGKKNHTETCTHEDVLGPGLLIWCRWMNALNGILYEESHLQTGHLGVVGGGGDSSYGQSWAVDSSVNDTDYIKDYQGLSRNKASLLYFPVTSFFFSFNP